jgi:protein-tyrosine phosphatase
MAKYMFEDLVNRKGLKKQFFIDSAATSFEENGNGMHYGAKDKLDEKGIPYGNHKAKRIMPEDYEKYDYIIGMEESNIKNIERIVGEDRDNKIYRLLDFSNNPRDIADPWYTGNFNNTYNDLVEGLNAYLDFLIKKGVLNED